MEGRGRRSQRSAHRGEETPRAGRGRSLTSREQLDVARELLDAALVDARRQLSKARRPLTLRQRDKLFAESIPLFSAELGGYFESMVDRILPVKKAQAFDWDPDDAIDWAEEERRLREVIGSWYIALGEAAYTAAGEELGADIGRDARAPGVKRILKLLAAQVRSITDTSRQAVRDYTATALDRGYTLQQLVRGVDDDGFKGLRDLVGSWGSTPAGGGESRAMTIARTETATAYNAAAVGAYEDSGLVGTVEVLDGDSDAGCAAANGQIWTLEQAAANAIEHPNCVRAFAPVASA